MLNLIVELEQKPYLHITRRGAQRLLDAFSDTDDLRAICAQVDSLRSRIHDEIDSVFCVSLTETERSLYEPEQPLFGNEIELKFPAMSEDISEAGKCLGLGRATAAVFHLMRVVELALQRFGTELGIVLVEQKNWQNILDEVNKAIKALDHREHKTKLFAEISAHLYSVKVAWRNEVMHPKQTYTMEQAQQIFSNVRCFVAALSDAI